VNYMTLNRDAEPAGGGGKCPSGFFYEGQRICFAPSNIGTNLVDTSCGTAGEEFGLGTYNIVRNNNNLLWVNHRLN
jgi:hypothetical protein